MKTLLNLFVFLFVSFVLFSCEKEDEEIGLINKTADSRLLQTRSANAYFDADKLLEQLAGVPVNIYYEAGAVAAEKQYLGCLSNGSYKLTFNNKDDGSGRQRWLISEHLSGYSIEYGLEVLGGYKNGMKYLVDYPLPPKAGIDPFPSLGAERYFSNGYWHITFNKEKWYIDQSISYEYIYNATWGTPDFKYLSSSPYDVLGASFFIYPVEKFNLQSVDYKTVSDPTYVTPEIVYLTSRPLVNDTPYEAERTAQISENYNYTSNFSQTQGLTISETVTVGAGFSVSVPIINVGLNGKIETSTRTDHTYSFTTGKTESFGFSFSQTIKQTLPPNTTIIAYLQAKKYSFNTNYTGNFVGENSRKVLKLNGIWGGVQYYEVQVVLTTPQGKVLGRIDSNANYKVANSVEYIDIQNANAKIQEYELEKASNNLK